MADQGNGLHNYAVNPSVASWVESTVQATRPEAGEDEHSDREADAFYRPYLPPGHEPHHLDEDMTAKQRQNPAGSTASRLPTARTAPRPGFRSASGPASSTQQPKTSPSVPGGGRPSVKSLAQRFNQVPSAEATAPRVRPARSIAPTKPTPSSSDAAPNFTPTSDRATKEPAAYGSYKFNNLKPRERPQPAPATPGGGRRTNAGSSRPSFESATSASRAKQTSPSKVHKRPPSALRAPFFGEVVGGDHDNASPGYGISQLDRSRRSSESHAQSDGGMFLSNEGRLGNPDLAPTGLPVPTVSDRTPSPVVHRRKPSDNTPSRTGENHRNGKTSNRQRITPNSKLPVPRRKTSSASSSNSSVKSSSRTPVSASRVAKPRVSVTPRNENSPRHQTRSPGITLSAKRYDGSPPKGLRNGASLTAVINAPPPQTSPRLRNSRERQPLPSASRSTSRSGSIDRHIAGEIPSINFQQHQSGGLSRPDEAQDTSAARESLHVVDESADAASYFPELAVTQSHGESFEHERVERVIRDEDQSLTLNTNILLPPSRDPEPLTAGTEFEEESPVLGMPGGFTMTPPTLHQSSPETVQEEMTGPAPEPSIDPPTPEKDKVLSPQTFEKLEEGRRAVFKDMESVAGAPSAYDGRESIPIILRDTPMLSPNNDPWQKALSQHTEIDSPTEDVYPPKAPDVTSYLQEEDSPIDPFDKRSTLRPEDSVSVIQRPGQQPPLSSSQWAPSIPPAMTYGQFTLDSEAYSVINRVLDHYHNSSVVTPEMAHGFQQEVHAVSPSLAQHRDWDSKEATETYLARLLSDANIIQDRNADHSPSVAGKTDDDQVWPSIRDLDDSPDVVGTGYAWVYETPRRRDSQDSVTTTILDKSSAGTAKSTGSRDQEHLGINVAHRATDGIEHKPIPPPKDTQPVSTTESAMFFALRDVDPDEEQSLLPRIKTASPGLGLGIHPPPPKHSPPPPPAEFSVFNEQRRSLSEVGTYLEENAYTRLPWTGNETQDPSPTVPSSKASSIKDLLPATGKEEDEIEGAETAEAEKKRLKHRLHQLVELCTTETKYIQDLMIIEDIYKATSTSVRCLTEKDRKILFGNVQELISVSKRFFRALSGAVKYVYKPRQSEWTINGKVKIGHVVNAEAPSKEKDMWTTVGETFMDFLGEFERVYGDYLKNHSHANQILKRIKDDQEAKIWQQECQKFACDITDAWSLDSLLVKPTQRIMRYPLVLDGLLKDTPEDHPDYELIEMACRGAKDVNNRINQAVRRQEMIDELLNVKGKSERLNKEVKLAIPKQTFLKVFGFKKPQAGMADKVDDPEYDRVTQRFGGHFFQLQIVMRDVERHLDEVTYYFNQCYYMAISFIAIKEKGRTKTPELEAKWRMFALMTQEICHVALPDYRNRVRRSVVEPICELWIMHDKPQTLMEKRKALAYDYQKWKTATEKGNKVDKRLQECADMFHALSDSLKAELPLLYTKTKKLIGACLQAMLGHQLIFYHSIELKLRPLFDVDPFPATGPPSSFAKDVQTYAQEFSSDFASVHAEVMSYAICNKELLNVAYGSPPVTGNMDETQSRKSSSKRTQSLSSDISNDLARNSANWTGVRQSSESTPFLNGQSSSMNRFRAGSAAGRGPSSPRNEKPGSIPSRPSTANYQPANYATQPFNQINRNSFENGGLLSPQPNLLPGQSPPILQQSRGSGVFSSALPMPESPAYGTDYMPEDGFLHEPNVIFLAASLFEFNIAHDRQEGGYPYLVYVPGEIFDVIGMKGELWLARNQDDKSGTIGWIWEKHFARILPDDES